MGLPCFLNRYGLPLIPDGLEFLPSAAVFKPLDVIRDEIFPYGYGISGCLCLTLVLSCFLAHVFQQSHTGKITPDFFISLLLVAFECKAVIPVRFLHNNPCGFLLGIHGIRSNDAPAAVKPFHDRLHFGDLIGFLVNPRTGQADAPFCGHHIKFVQVTQVLRFFSVLFRSMPGFLSICSNDVLYITVQFFILIQILVQVLSGHFYHLNQDLFEHTLQLTWLDDGKDPLHRIMGWDSIL